MSESDPEHDRDKPGSRRPLLWLVVVLAIVALGVIATVLVGSSPVRVVGAVDAQAVLPDGQVVDLEGDMDLPDGTVVVVGPEGSANVGETELGPNARAIIVDGDVQVTTDDVSKPAPSPALGTTEPAPDGTGTPETPDASAEPTSSPAADGGAEQDRPVVDFELSAQFRESTVGLAWPAFTRDDFDHYSIIRWLAQGDPTPDNGEVIGRIFNPQDTGWIDEVANPRQARYRILVHDADGRLIGRSDAPVPTETPG